MPDFRMVERSSEPDPYWILPLIMAGFMALQSLMSQPSRKLSKMDEQQRCKSTKMTC